LQVESGDDADYHQHNPNQPAVFGQEGNQAEIGVDGRRDQQRSGDVTKENENEFRKDETDDACRNENSE
jgi:hypothetical protein